MQKVMRVLIFSLAQFIAIDVLAYEVGTHAEMSTAAIRASTLNRPSDKTLFYLGFGVNYLGLNPRDPNNRGISNGAEARTITGWVRVGAGFEDTLTETRPKNHFFDPFYNRPLTVLGIARGETSSNWAPEDTSDFGGQDNSFSDARGYLYKALTLPTKAERDRHFGLTFQTLGHVIHHIQDMAQPQHVRNDAHCDRWYCIGSLSNPSRYEKYTDINSGNLPYTGYPSLLFADPRRFWSTGDGRGMAEFSNANFVSAGTNYQLLAGQPAANSEYLLPQPSGFGQPTSIGDLLAEEGLTTPLTGTVDFVENPIWDRNTGIQATNPRSSTHSIFDADLTAYNATVSYSLFGPRVTVDRLFTLNRFNFKAAYPQLIPKAVAYGAGMIDYFFRGRIGGWLS